MIFVFVFS